MIKIAVFAEKIKYKHYNYSIILMNLKAVMQFKASIN